MKSVVVLLLVASLILVSFSELNVVVGGDGRVVVPDDYSGIQEEVDAVEEGDTVFVRSGVYFGPVNRTLVINKSISLVGEDPETTVLNLHPPWVQHGWWGPGRPRMVYNHPIIIKAEGVRISGFTITTTVKGLQKLRVNNVGSQITGNILETVLTISLQHDVGHSCTVRKTVKRSNPQFIPVFPRCPSGLLLLDLRR